MTKVLVVDDDTTIVNLMRDFLEAEGFQVEGALDAAQALAIIGTGQTNSRSEQGVAVDCVLLDVMMPGQSGFDLLRQLRGVSEVPVLFLTARGADTDKIRGLALGGDDYIVKSATPSEVVARVKAVLRRSRSSGGHSREESSQHVVLDLGRVSLDVGAREVTVDGKIVPFTPKEFDLLSLFAEHPRQVFTYEQLLERLWDDTGDRHTVTVHIERVRKKIEEDPSKPSLLVNVWGVGYRFEGKKL